MRASTRRGGGRARIERRWPLSVVVKLASEADCDRGRRRTWWRMLLATLRYASQSDQADLGDGRELHGKGEDY